KSSIRRIHYERCALGRYDLCSAFEPELIICTRVAFWRRAINATLSCSLFQFGRLVTCKKVFLSQLLGSFDGREGSITPNSLQVGVAPRSMWRSPLLRGPNSFPVLGHGGAGRQGRPSDKCQSTTYVDACGISLNRVHLCWA